MTRIAIIKEDVPFSIFFLKIKFLACISYGKIGRLIIGLRVVPKSDEEREKQGHSNRTSFSVKGAHCCFDLDNSWSPGWLHHHHHHHQHRISLTYPKSRPTSLTSSKHNAFFIPTYPPMNTKRKGDKGA